MRRMEVMLKKGVRGAKIRCRGCGNEERQNKIEVSVRSALFALLKANVISDAELKAQDKEWKSYARKNGLNMYGKQKT